MCSNRFDGIGRKSFCFFSHFIVVSSHWVFLIKYKDVWLVGMLEAMLLDDHLCVLVGYTGVMYIRRRQTKLSGFGCVLCIIYGLALFLVNRMALTIDEYWFIKTRNLMNIGFRLCFTQSSVVCPSIFISSMPSVKVRFERSKQHEDRGSIYYRIYYGHNRRFEFSARILLPVEAWDAQNRCVFEHVPGGYEAQTRIRHDVELLDRMIADENQIATASSLGNLVKRFKKITQNRALNLVNMSNVAKGESQTM